MKDIYKDYTGKIFYYYYPFTWDNRVPEYLETTIDRKKYQDYMFPPKYEGLNECQQNYSTLQIKD